LRDREEREEREGERVRGTVRERRERGETDRETEKQTEVVVVIGASELKRWGIIQRWSHYHNSPPCVSL